MWTMKPGPNRLIAGQAPDDQNDKDSCKDREHHAHHGRDKSQVDPVAPVAAPRASFLGRDVRTSAVAVAIRTPEIKRTARGKQRYASLPLKPILLLQTGICHRT